MSKVIKSCYIYFFDGVLSVEESHSLRTEAAL